MINRTPGSYRAPAWAVVPWVHPASAKMTRRAARHVCRFISLTSAQHDVDRLGRLGNVEDRVGEPIDARHFGAVEADLL